MYSFQASNMQNPSFFLFFAKGVREERESVSIAGAEMRLGGGAEGIPINCFTLQGW